MKYSKMVEMSQEKSREKVARVKIEIQKMLDRKERVTVMLSRLVDTFFSRTSWTMLLYAENHSISVA